MVHRQQLGTHKTITDVQRSWRTNAGEDTKTRRTLKFREPSISQLTHIPGFPHFIEPRHRLPLAHIYGRGLLSSGNGYPLWRTRTNTVLPAEYYLHGISIGDVGVLHEGGTFQFCFNIFLPADHPYNMQGTPASFTPLEPLEPSETRRIANYFPPGFVMTSSDIEMSRNPQAPKDILFESSAPRGAVLILPDGATREDISTPRLNEYIKEHAFEWYRYLAPYAINGSIYVVTGCDKASSRSAFSYPFHTLDDFEEGADIKASYKNGYLYATHPDSGFGLAFNEKPEPGSDKVPNLCIFLRGMRVFLGGAEWVQCSGNEPNDQYLELSTLSSPSLAHTNLRSVPKKVIVAPSSTNLSDNLSSNISSFDNDHGDDSSEGLSEVFFHAALYPLHPSDIVAQILLCEFPESSMVILDDAIWSSWLEDNSRPDSNAPTFQCSGTSITELSALIIRIFHCHDVIEQDRVLALTRNSKKGVSDISWISKLRRLIFRHKSDEKDWANDAICEFIQQGQKFIG